MPVSRGWRLIFAKPKERETELLKQPVHVPCARVRAAYTWQARSKPPPPVRADCACGSTPAAAFAPCVIRTAASCPTFAPCSYRCAHSTSKYTHTHTHTHASTLTDSSVFTPVCPPTRVSHPAPQIHLFDVDVPNGPLLMESRTTAPGSQVGEGAEEEGAEEGTEERGLWAGEVGWGRGGGWVRVGLRRGGRTGGGYVCSRRAVRRGGRGGGGTSGGCGQVGA